MFELRDGLSQLPTCFLCLAQALVMCLNFLESQQKMFLAMVNKIMDLHVLPNLAFVTTIVTKFMFEAHF
jgi:hypothetical protein